MPVSVLGASRVALHKKIGLHGNDLDFSKALDGVCSVSNMDEHSTKTII